MITHKFDDLMVAWNRFTYQEKLVFIANQLSVTETDVEDMLNDCDKKALGKDLCNGN